MDEYIKHANHNDEFHSVICMQYPDQYHDWKIVCLFYISIHHLKSLAKLRKKEIGKYHHEINKNIKPGHHNPAMPISNTARRNYMRLFHYSQEARYKAIKDIEEFKDSMKEDYEHAIQCYTDFKKFIISSGVRVS